MDGIDYTASKTAAEFHNGAQFVRALMGPIGSGKSVACIMELLIKAFAQDPHTIYDEDGNVISAIRKTRWVIIRNTYRELIDTTINTFFDWFPERLGRFHKMDLKFTFNIRLPDGTAVQTEFLFRALDKPTDIKKLLSLEVTGGFINEAREVPKQIMDMLIGRLGRYPNKRQGGPSWYGLIMDTNPPDSDHWWYKLFEVDCPETYKLYKQPSGLSPEAENIENLPVGYYINMQAGKDQEWINVYVLGLYGFVSDGKPVFPEYKDAIHYTSEELTITTHKTIYVGIDFGLTPAAVFCQKTSTGRWLVFDELVSEDMGARNFGTILNQKINAEYQGYDLEIYGDPAGDERAQTDEQTPYDILYAVGISAVPTYTNDPIIRREAIASTLMRMDFAGNTGFIIGPGAPMFRKSMAGGYKYRRMAVAGQERFMDKPDKGRYSHVNDACQYAFVGAGEGGALISSPHEGKKLDYSHIDRAIM